VRLIIYKILKLIQTRLLPDELYSKVIFRKLLKYPLNLNDPKTLNEKLHWMKLRGPKFIDSTLVDKLAVRGFVAEKVTEKYLIPLVASYESELDIKQPLLEDLPLIIKPTHDSGIGAIYRRVDDHCLDDVKKFIGLRLNKNHYYTSKEYPYRNLKPKVIVEKLLQDKQGRIPDDFKFHYFSGNLEFIYCSIDREGDDSRHIYDVNWCRQSFSWGKDPSKFLKGDQDIPQPKNFKEMLKVSKKLAEGFPYVRVDLYNLDGQIFFGEMTFFQGSGFDRILPFEKDVELGLLVKFDNLRDLKI